MRNSPTQTIQQYWNGSSYVPQTSFASYDDMGRLMSTTDAESQTIAYQYDSLGRQTKIIYATGIEAESYYGCCNLLWSEDEDNRKTYYGYDDANRLIDTWTDIQGDDQSTDKLVHYTYDAYGNKAGVTTYSSSGVGRVTSYEYDKMNRVTKIIYPFNSQEGDLLGSEEFGYDDVGNLWWKIDGTGVVTLYRYDVLNRMVNVYYDYAGALPPANYPQQADVSYTYYGGSSLKQTMVDSTGTSQYEYDIQGRLMSYTPPVPSQHDAVEYTYNNLGQKTSITSGDYNVQYDYFANG